MVLNRVKYILIFCILLISSASVLASSKPQEQLSEDYLIDLYENKRYKDIIELSYGVDFKGFDQKLILAKSYDNLGYLNRAYRIYKDIYLMDDSMKGLCSYLIARMFYRNNRIFDSVNWYSQMVYQYKFRKNNKYNSDWKILLNYSLYSIYSIFIDNLRNKRIKNKVIRLFKDLKNDEPLSLYYLAVANLKLKNYGESFKYFEDFLLCEKFDRYKSELLRQYIRDPAAVRILLSDEMWENTIVDRLLEYGLYSEILQIGAIKRKLVNDEIKARCYENLGDYKTALIIYNNLYHKTGNKELLLKIADVYYKIKDYSRANKYAERYYRRKKKYEYVSMEYIVLKIKIGMKKGRYSSVFKNSKLLIEKYGVFVDIDTTIYRVFYFLVSAGYKDRALEIVKDYYPYIKNRRYLGWASYIIATFLDPEYYFETLQSYPGSYYYFRAKDHIRSSYNPLNNTNYVKADILADLLYKNKKYDQSLEKYIVAFSRGLNTDHVKSRIYSILSSRKPYRYYFQVTEMNRKNSFLYRIYYLGFFRELKEILSYTSGAMSGLERVYSNYLMAKMYYKTGNPRKGLMLIESITSNLNYKMFLPEEILKMIYPIIFYDEIKREVNKRGWFVDVCFILSIIREESRYNPWAVSGRGAVGLMQLMPDTAEWLIGKRVTRKMLLDPEFNISVGIIYLERLYQRYRDVSFVLAAYNGGPSNLYKWVSEIYDNDNDRFIELIPFNETRNFVKKVYTSYEYYKFLYHQKCF